MNTNQIMVKMILERWFSLMKRTDDLISSLPDEAFLNDIVPGKNRGIYLLGHLIAVHDELLPILNLSEKKHGDLTHPFLTSPDKEVSELPSVRELKSIWNTQYQELNDMIEGIPTEEWFGRHNSVSAEDFLKEPHRNKLNVILSRTTHLSYHLGQIILIAK